MKNRNVNPYNELPLKESTSKFEYLPTHFT